MRKILKSHAFEIFILGFVTLAIQISFYFNQHKNHSYPLQDPDCYMRLMRVQEWQRTGDWYSSIILRSNAPYGEILHWTRPLDILLLGGAKIFQSFFDFNKALEIFGIIISPLLQFASLFALSWAVLPWFNRQNRLRLSVLFLLQPASFTPYLTGRPDHHSLLIFLFILEIGCLIRILSDKKSNASYLLGFLSALSMWTSVESLVAIAFALGTLGLLWLQNKKNLSSIFQKFTASLFIFSAIFLFFDKSFSNFLTPEYDRLSIVHIYIFALLAAWGMIIQNLDRKKQLPSNIFSQIFLALISATIIASALLIMFPDFARGPYASVDARAMEIWLKGVKEVQPLWKIGSQPFYRIIIWVGPAFVCIPLMIKKLKHPSQEHSFWILISTGTILFLPLALYQIRWSYYAIIFLLIPFTILLDASIQWLEKKLRSPWFAVSRAFTIIAFSIGFLLIGICMMLSEEEKPSPARASVAELCDFLNKNFPEKQRIATFIDIGPEILYRTPCETIGSPYHRNGQGILFIHDLMTSQNDAQAMKLLHERNVQLVVIETHSHYAEIYQKNEKSLCNRLIHEEKFTWLEIVPLPKKISNSFKLFLVKK